MEGGVSRMTAEAPTSKPTLREFWMNTQRAECISEEQWLQEYCCVPADESTAFISFEMINSCEEVGLLMARGFQGLESLLLEQTLKEPQRRSVFYLGVDVARKKDLCVLDLGEKIGDVTWDRLRIELQGKTFAEIRFELY